MLLKFRPFRLRLRAFRSRQLRADAGQVLALRFPFAHKERRGFAPQVRAYFEELLLGQLPIPIRRAAVARFGHQHLIEPPVFFEELLVHQAKAVIAQPPPHACRLGVGLQHEASHPAQTVGVGRQNAHDERPAHAGQDEDVGLARLQHGQAVTQPHVDAPLQAVAGHLRPGRLPRSAVHVGGHGPRRAPRLHQVHRKLRMIGADIGHAAPGEHETGKGVQAFREGHGGHDHPPFSCPLPL